MTHRGKAFTQAEDDVIRILMDQGKSYRHIAAVLKRGKSTVGNRVRAMRDNDQGVLDLGQANAN